MRLKLLQSKAELAPVLPLTYHMTLDESIILSWAQCPQPQKKQTGELDGLPLPVPLALHADP